MTIPKECKRLAEVDFPIATVSAHAVREKKSRQGHPSTLHLWWARRPLAACRSVLLALLLPDPADPHCPPAFKPKARELLRRIAGCRDAENTDLSLRRAILKFIGEFANWDNASVRDYLEAARELVKAAHPDEIPLVVDPFAGGGSIPMEALRLGCEAFASDLNPVACLINKVLLEDIPRLGAELAEEYSKARDEVITGAERELTEAFPPDPDGAKPLVYLWAKTVRCEASACGAEIPLVKSFWLSQSRTRYRALRPVLHPPSKDTPGAEMRRVDFEIFTPSSPSDVRSPSVNQAKATCFYCSRALSPDRVRAQLREQQGGTRALLDSQGKRIGGAQLLAVVAALPQGQGRTFRPATQADYAAVRRAGILLGQQEAAAKGAGGSVIPSEPTPVDGTGSVGGGYRTRKYGVDNFGAFFTQRQLFTLVTLARLISQLRVSDACKRLLSCALSIFVRSCNGNARLRPDSSVAPAFGMQTLPITWTFPETVPWGGRSEHFDGATETVEEILRDGHLAPAATGQVQLADALASPLPRGSSQIWFTDPPYYDSIPYADLSDFSYVWLKRVLPPSALPRDPFDAHNQLTPKTREAVRDQQKHLDERPLKTSEWYERVMRGAFQEGYRVLYEGGIACVVFAHKTTEGWEALLSGLIDGGWTITGSWPISTESATRLRARESAALATSVHLVCRPRAADAKPGDWDDVQRELPQRIAEWMTRLQQEGVRGADLVFACIGPALEVYSRFPRVLDANDNVIPLGGDPEAKEPHQRGFLAYVWELVGRAALQEVLKKGADTGLEEDARLTALFLWTLQATASQLAEVTDEEDEDEESDDSNEEDEEEEDGNSKKPKGFALPFDVVRRFAQPLGIHLEGWERWTITTAKGVVKLIPVVERSELLLGKGDATPADATPPAKSKKKVNATPSFPEMLDDPVEVPAKGQKNKKTKTAEAPAARDLTTLDRVHKAMLLQASGQTGPLRELLKEEQARGPEFLRLANALSPLYPTGSWEKQKLDAMLQAIPK